MKAQYPVEFIASLLTSETGNADKAVKYINEARGMSISILPPDVNESDLYFTPVGESIRFGLAAIKNVGENTAKAIRGSRTEQGRFKSLYDFCERIEPKFLNKRVFESLIKSGAMDSVGPRESMLASVDDAVAALQRVARNRESGQHGLFGGGSAPAAAPFELRDAAPWSGQEARRIEDIVEKAANQEFRVRMNMQALNDAMLDQLERLFEGTPGMSQVIFELVSGDGTVATVASQQRVKVTPELLEAVRRLKGEQAAA